MKKAGIAIDSYKVKKFKELISEKGWKISWVSPKPDSKGVVFYTVKVPDNEVMEMKKLLQEVELFYKRGN